MNEKFSLLFPIWLMAGLFDLVSLFVLVGIAGHDSTENGMIFQMVRNSYLISQRSFLVLDFASVGSKVVLPLFMAVMLTISVGIKFFNALTLMARHYERPDFIKFTEGFFNYHQSLVTGSHHVTLLYSGSLLSYLLFPAIICTGLSDPLVNIPLFLISLVGCIFMGFALQIKHTFISGLKSAPHQEGRFTATNLMKLIALCTAILAGILFIFPVGILLQRVALIARIGQNREVRFVVLYIILVMVFYPLFYLSVILKFMGIISGFQLETFNIFLSSLTPGLFWIVIRYGATSFDIFNWNLEPATP